MEGIDPEYAADEAGKSSRQRDRRGVVPGRVVLALLLSCALAASLCWNAAASARASAWLSGLRCADEGILLGDYDAGCDGDHPLVVAPGLAGAYDGVVSTDRADGRRGGEARVVITSRPPSQSNLDRVSGRFPRTIGLDGSVPDGPYFATDGDSNAKRRIDVDRHVMKIWRHIEDDNFYPPADEGPPECVPASPWPSLSHPSCNSFHELDLRGKTLDDAFRYVASGGYNDVFRIHNDERRRRAPSPTNEPDPDLALKLLSPGKKHAAGIPQRGAYSRDNYEVARRDALVLDMLTSSPQVLPIYGYCGFAVVVPFADGGTLAGILSKEWSRGERVRWKNLTPATRLKYALDAAKGLADIHDVDVVHGDLTIKQYMSRDGTLQLGDFNQGIFLRKNTTVPNDGSGSPYCTFVMTKNYGTTRAPEEYKHEPQTSAVDVWSLGSIIYHLLTGKKVWSGRYTKKQAQDAVAGGALPEVGESVLRSSDPVDRLLRRALDMCYVYDPGQRATAREVAAFLERGWRELR